MPDTSLETLIEASFENPALFGELYAELVAAELFVLTASDDGADGSRFFDAGEEVPLVNFQLEDGTPFVPVFTSLEQVEQSIDQDLGYFSANGWGLLNLVQTSNVVINPSSDNALFLTPENIAEILEYFGTQDIVVDEATEVLVGQPEEDPVELKKAIAQILGQNPYVHSAYLCMLVNPASMESTFRIGVVFVPGKEDRSIFKMAGAAATKYIPAGMALDFMIITNDHDDDEIAASLLNDGDKFYQAKTAS